jgi:hydroxyethylthiazole kinase-like uncharacterized protein yjeF
MFGYKPTIWMPKVASSRVAVSLESYTFNSQDQRTYTRSGAVSISQTTLFADDVVQRLHKQCQNMDIPTLPTSENTLSTALASSDVVLDAIFGFSFQPPVRTPFNAALPLLARAGIPIVSVDIPSGWDVERGDAAGLGLHPDVLVSLTAPKEGVRAFTGRHFLGGRFVSR